MQNPKSNPPGDKHGAAIIKPSHTGRRSFTRYPVNLEGTITNTDERNLPCKIRDFCLTGILLEYLPSAEPSFQPEVGDVFTIHCTVPIIEGATKVIFHARVARTTEGGAGLAFIEPNKESLQIMQQFALQFPVDERRNQRHTLHSSDKAAQYKDQLSAAIHACNQVVDRSLENILAQLFNKISSQLFEMSRDTHDPAVQNDLFNASDIIKRNTATLQNSLRAGVHIRLSNPIQAEISNEIQDDNDLSLEDMSLIEDQDLGVWIAISEITGKIEERNKEELLPLEERLTHLYNVNISNVNNPYAPALFAEPFQTALSQYGFSQQVGNICHGVFKDILIAESATFYNKLNAALITHDVLPSLTYKTIRKATQAKQASKPELNHRHDGDSELLPENLIEQAKSLYKHKQDMTAAEKPAQTDALSRGRRHSRDTQAHPQEFAPQDLYSVMQELRDLRQSISQLNVATMPARKTAQIHNENYRDLNSGHQSSPELINALNKLQLNDEASLEKDHNHIKFRILSGLAEKGEQFKLSPHDNNILDVMGDLLLAMHDDPMVSDSVRPWLKKLELPIAKLALQDPTLFLDQTHIARQVVNKIAQLEFHDKSKNNSGQNAISTAIEQLLQRIITEHVNGPDIYNEIHGKLSSLVKIQEKAYADNIDDIIHECMAHAPSIYDCEKFSPTHVLSKDEMRKWRLHARRLKKDDYVIYKETHMGARRLRVAWLNDDGSIYIFVNSKGLKEKIIHIDDIAYLVSISVISLQINAQDPPMDRAQYAIMQELYQQVLHESTHDSTTGLMNRREFENNLGSALADAKKSDTRHALLFIDVDKFSAINNSCGYAGGDRLLVDLVDILKREMDESGAIARLGSDEIGILLQGCTIDGALAIAERQIEAVNEYRLAWGDNLFSVTLSIGLVPISARSTDVSSLLQSAESSCNAAKDVGGNRLQLFHAGHARIAHQSEVMKWIGKIDKMLENDDLEIRCQRIEPIRDANAQEPHYEILLGINNDQGQLISPQDFIKAAEW